MRVGKSGTVGSSGDNPFQRSMLDDSACFASGMRDWEMRTEARVWRGSGVWGEERRASVMRASQRDSAFWSHLFNEVDNISGDSERGKIW